MGRTQIARSIIAELQKRIVICKQNKQKLISYVQTLKNKCINREINYYEYEQTLQEKRDGKTLEEWLDFYDSYIEDCKERIKQQQNKIVKNKIAISFVSFAVILFIILAVFYIRPAIVGLVIQEKQEFTQALNLEFSETSEYIWNLEYLGQLNSVKISGLIQGQGEVKVYLDDLLILDNVNLQKKSASSLTGGAVQETEQTDLITKILGLFKELSKLTGRAAKESLESPSQEPTQPKVKESSSEQTSEEALQTESPSQQEPLPSGGTEKPVSTSETSVEEPTSTSEQSEEPSSTSETQPDEEEITETIEPQTPTETSTEQPSEEETTSTQEQPTTEEIEEETIKQAEENITEQETEEIEQTIIEFTDICEQTCNLKKLNLNKASYTLRIQITNAKLELSEIKYEIIPISAEEIQEILENITTSEENITIITNITEIPENITLNITENFSVSTLQYKAKIGEPVKWKKTIDLEKPGIIKIELPSSAENITVNKIIEKSAETKALSSQPSSEQISEEAPQKSPSQQEPLPSEGTEEPIFTSEQASEPASTSEASVEETISTPETEQEQPEQEKEEKIIETPTQLPIEEQQTKEKAKATITGRVAIEIELKEKSIFNSILNFLKKTFSTLTGRAITTEETPKTIELTIEDNATKYEIEYETPAPEAFEEQLGNTKKITISAPEELNYTDVLAYTELPNSPEKKVRLYHITNETKEQVNITKYDLDQDGTIDYVEWIIPELSENQTYELIIEISNAEHLDSERNFISDIYNEVYQLDDIWSETIPDTHYVRVIFRQPLDNTRDITIFPRIISGNPVIKVYEKDKTDLVAEFSSLNSNEYNRVYLTNLQGEQDVFDLLIINGNIEIDHIIDPTAMQYFLIGTTTAGSGGTGDMFASTGSATAIWTPTASGNYFTWIKKYTETTTLDIQTFSLGFYCNQSGSAGGDSIKIGSIDIYDCGTSADCSAQDFTICSSNTVNIDCESGATVEHEVASCTSSGSRTLDANDYLGVRLTSSTNKAAYPSVEFNSSTYNTYFNVTETIQDNTAPTLTINYPQNTTYNRGIGDVNEINFTAHDETELSACWYSTDDGINNYSNADWTCYENFTSVTSLQGSNNFTVWANDTNSNEQTASVVFVKDTLTPSFSNYIDDNSSHEGTGQTGNFSVDVLNTNGTVLLQINNTNYTAEEYTSGKYNASVLFDLNGTWQYYWISYSNFSENINTSEDILLFYTINGTPPDGTPPTLTIDYPANTTYNLLNIDVNEINFTASDNVALDVCWYSTDNGIINSSFNDCFSNFTSVTSLEGSNNFTVWANDSLGNEQTASVVFVKDTYIPVFSNYWDDNSSKVGTGQTGNFSVDIIDTNGTVLLQINNTNYTAEEYTSGKYNASVLFDLNDTWSYYWISYSNFSQNLNTSEDILNFYTINNTLNTAPIITYVSPIPDTDPTAASTVSVHFNLTVYDEDGVSNINNDTVMANFTNEGEAARVNSTCSSLTGEVTDDDKSQNFTCSIDIWYWDENADWNITAYAEDNSAESAINDSTTFLYKQLISIEIAPSSFTLTANMGAENSTSSDDPILINNTGNANITEGNVQINAINLYGTTGDFIDAGNFTSDIDTGGDACTGAACIECDGTFLSNGSDTGITNAFLARGNLSLGDGTAQEQLYFCMLKIPSGIPSQSYSTSEAGSSDWIIKIVIALAVFYLPRKRKKKSIKNDKLVKALTLITDELKEEYSLNKKEIIQLVTEKLNEKYKLSKKEILELIKEKEEFKIPVTIFSKKLGALEAITKYLKENLNLSYRGISKLLNRNERTIWTSYNKTIKKHPEKLQIRETDLNIPISIFKNRKLTILESIILYLKEKGYKHSEIAELLNRDQRNIWTIYSRTVRKLKRKL